MAWRGWAVLGEARHGHHGKARLGEAGRGGAGQGMDIVAGQGSAEAGTWILSGDGQVSLQRPTHLTNRQIRGRAFGEAATLVTVTTTVNDFGEPVQAEVEAAITCATAPPPGVNDSRIRQLQEAGIALSAMRMFWTVEQPRPVANDSAGDIIVYGGERFRVHSVAPWGRVLGSDRRENRGAVSKIETCSETRYSVAGSTGDIPQAVSDALAERSGEDGWSCEITLWGEFGYRFHGVVGDDGIVTYEAKKTGHDGDFRVEGRGYTRDVLVLMDLFFQASKA